MTKVLCALDGGPGLGSMTPETTVLCLWMMTVNLKIFGSKGRWPAQSPGKVKSTHKHRSHIPADAGLQLTASATCLATLRRKGAGFLLSSSLLSGLFSGFSLLAPQLLSLALSGKLIEAGKHVDLLVRRCLGFN